MMEDKYILKNYPCFEQSIENSQSLGTHIFQIHIVIVKVIKNYQCYSAICFTRVRTITKIFRFKSSIFFNTMIFFVARGLFVTIFVSLNDDHYLLVIHASDDDITRQTVRYTHKIFFHTSPPRLCDN
jgi:hypothetical protein